MLTARRAKSRMGKNPRTRPKQTRRAMITPDK